MHPIIKSFIENNLPLDVILNKVHDKNNYLESVLLKICNLRNVVLDIDPKIYDEIDQAIVKGHEDANIFLLFIGIAIDFTSRRKHTEKANVLLTIGSSLTTEKIHPTVHAIYLVTIGTLKYYQNKNDEGRVIYRKALSMVNKGEPRYINVLIGFAGLIALEGRLKDLTKEELELIDKMNIERYKFNYFDIKLSDCILTGNFKKGLEYFPEFKKSFPADATYIIEGKKYLLQLLSGDFDEKNYKSEKYKMYANVCKDLSLGNIEEASKQYEVMNSRNWQNVGYIPFERYLPLHIQLCFKNKGQVKLLMQEVLEFHSPNYMDDFFLGRLQLLESNIIEAQITFKRLMENIYRYDSMNRLAFELQFAKELKSSDILFFINGFHQNLNIVEDSNRVETISKSKKVLKGVKQLIGESHTIVQVKKLIKQFANLREPVLITGETGTGKELVARAIHEEGPFANDPFLAINCGSLTDSLLQSELFGYVAGAFTGAQKERIGIFEAAGNGTVFLDEFGDISPKMQVSLLRVLESNEIRLIGGTGTRQIKCKIVIATNVELFQAVNEKKFREDLYFRLTRYDIKMPPLRVRVEDIPILINFYMEDKQLSKPLLDSLIKYSWPGNIRELKNEIERLKLIHSEKKIIEIDDFDFKRLQGYSNNNSLKNIEENITKPLTKTNNKKDLEEDEVLNIIQRGNKVDQRHQYIKELFIKYKKLTRSQIMEIVKISPVTATKDMEILCQSGFIKRITPTKSVKSHYFELVE